MDPFTGPGPGWLSRQVASNRGLLRDGTFIGLGSRPEFTRLDQRILKVYRSKDNLQTVVGPADAVLDIPLGTGGRSENSEYHGAALVEHSLIERRDGTLIACAYGWWKGNEEYSMLEKYVPEMNMYKTRVWVISLRDRGKTWQTLGTPGYWPELGPEGMGEPGMTELANGDLLMVLRNGEWGEPIFQTRSTDGGRTWSKPRKLPATGVCPTPCLLSNGMLVVAVDRGRPANYYLWVSPDGRGETWTSQTLIAKAARATRPLSKSRLVSWFTVDTTSRNGLCKSGKSRSNEEPNQPLGVRRRNSLVSPCRRKPDDLRRTATMINFVKTLTMMNDSST